MIKAVIWAKPEKSDQLEFDLEGWIPEQMIFEFIPEDEGLDTMTLTLESDLH